MTKNINIALEGINVSHGYPVSSQPVINVKGGLVINGDGPPDLFQQRNTLVYQ